MGSLQEYNEKRHFMRTPEPFGEVVTSDPDTLRFAVHRHFASREHFDLRLEWNGVLMSWAVPEGPSLNSKDRRLAIATEDHPIAYAQFEGEIPKGEYGAGMIIVWDQGSWVPVTAPPDEALANGELKFRLAGSKLKGGFTLVKLPKGEKEWLWIKERDSHVSTTDVVSAAPGSVLKSEKISEPGKLGPIPEKLRPQLATSEPVPPEGDKWVHEIKYDGYRTLLMVEDGQVRTLTRNGHDWTDKYRSIAEATAQLDCDTAIIDGEIIVQDPRGAASF